VGHNVNFLNDRLGRPTRTARARHADWRSSGPRRGDGPRWGPAAILPRLTMRRSWLGGGDAIPDGATVVGIRRGRRSSVQSCRILAFFGYY
jgi:hypothetical protein